MLHLAPIDQKRKIENSEKHSMLEEIGGDSRDWFHGTQYKYIATRLNSLFYGEQVEERDVNSTVYRTF